jgi:hypothetical protein
VIEAKEAVRTAIAYVRDIYGDQAEDVLLEEIDRDSENGAWLITVSFVRPGLKIPLGQLGIPAWMASSPRQYKVIAVDDNGHATSMKMRNHD